MKRKRLSLRSDMSDWAAAGGEHAFITLALPHNDSDDLRTRIEKTERARKFLFTFKEMTASARQELRKLGFIDVAYWVLEIANRTGWHPHVHLVARLRPGTTDTNTQRLVGYLVDRLNKFLDARGEPVNTAMIRGDRIRAGTEHTVARYVTKGSESLVQELKLALDGNPDAPKRFGMQKAIAHLMVMFRSTAGITMSRISRLSPKRIVPNPEIAGPSQVDHLESGAPDGISDVDRSIAMNMADGRRYGYPTTIGPDRPLPVSTQTTAPGRGHGKSARIRSFFRRLTPRLRHQRMSRSRGLDE